MQYAMSECLDNKPASQTDYSMNQLTFDCHAGYRSESERKRFDVNEPLPGGFCVSAEPQSAAKTRS